MAHADVVTHIQDVVHEKYPDLKEWAFVRQVFLSESDVSSPEFIEAEKRQAAVERKQHEESLAAAEEAKAAKKK